MPIIDDERLSKLMQSGQARLDRPGRFRMVQPQKVQQKEDLRLKTMQEVLATLKGMAGRDDSQNTELLKSIEALLKQLIAIYTAPKETPVEVKPKRNKPNWKFQINRDRNGRLETIEAIPDEGE